MKKALFFLGYALTPALPLFLYLRAAGGGLTAYSASMALGICAFVLICNQFILASRPAFAVKALGLKGLLSFHGTVPGLVLMIAGVHKILKESSGFSDDSLQASFGTAAWWAFAAVIVLAVLFMANTFWMRLKPLKALRDWTYKTFKLNYRIARLLHNLTVLAGISILVHVFLASSSNYAVNPAGMSLMALWMAFSLGTYASYRFKPSKGRQ